MVILKTRGGVLDAADEAAFQALEQKLATGGVNLLLHLHGGLVDEAHGAAIATGLGGLAPLGFGLTAPWEQVFVIWRTGLLETLKTNWTDLFENDRLYKTLLKRVLDFVASRLGLPGIGGRSAFDALALSPTEIAMRLEARPPGDPFADVDIALETGGGSAGRGAAVSPQTDGQIARDFMDWLQRDIEFNNAVDNIAAALTVDTTGRSLSPRGDPIEGEVSFNNLPPALRAELVTTAPAAAAGRSLFTGVDILGSLLKHGALIAVRVIKRFRHRRDHGFYATVVEELVRELYGDILGAAIWGMMKTDGSDHFKPGGMGERLVKLLTAHPPAILTVSGHSAGSIWASEMLIAMSTTPNAPAMRLSFMAPAVRTDLFAEALDKGGHLIKAFRMFTMHDDLERKDAVLGHQYGYIYPSSLLYLISGVLENRSADAFPDAPILGMQRFMTQDAGWLADAEEIAAVGKAMAFLTLSTSGLVLSQVNGGPGLSSQATSHGGFDQDADTVASVAVFAP